MEVKVIDRGVDEILVVNDKKIRIDKMKGKEVIELLNSLGITNLKVISFDENQKQTNPL